MGTETDGSITCPASNNNLAGIKPTVGLVSRAGGKRFVLVDDLRSNLLNFLVIPISEHQDTVGPMARSLTDAAIVLSVIAGKDPNDNFTLAQPPVVPDFTRALNKDALKGKRLGVPRRVFLDDSITGNDPFVNVVFEQALVTIKSLGATVIDPANMPSADEIANFNNETIVAIIDFKVGLTLNSDTLVLIPLHFEIQINAWFESLVKNPSSVRSLADLIAFNDANPDLEKPKGFESQSVCAYFR